MVPNIGIFVFSQDFPLDKSEGIDFKYDQSIVKILAQKHPNKAFLFFRKILQLDKYEGADFRYDNIVFKFQSKNT